MSYTGPKKCGWRQFWGCGECEGSDSANAASNEIRRRCGSLNFDEMMKLSKVDADVRMSDRMTKKAEVLGFQIKVVRYTATCEPFHAGLGGRVEGQPIAIVQHHRPLIIRIVDIGCWSELN
jgi:hypothetical protein